MSAYSESVQVEPTAGCAEAHDESVSIGLVYFSANEPEHNDKGMGHECSSRADVYHKEETNVLGEIPEVSYPEAAQPVRLLIVSHNVDNLLRGLLARYR